MMSEYKKIVLTGGPCAGKTTALVRIIEYFSSFGYKVFAVPEVPTLYSQGGWNYLTSLLPNWRWKTVLNNLQRCARNLS